MNDKTNTEHLNSLDCKAEKNIQNTILNFEIHYLILIVWRTGL